MTNVRQNLVRLLIGSAATVFFFWLFLQIAHLGDAWKEIRSLPGWAIGGALGFVLANVGFISLRWRYLFSAARYQTQARRLLPIFCVGLGALIFAIPDLPGIIPHPSEETALVERLSELVVIIALMGAGANNVLPARGGDLLRIESVRQYYRIPPFVTAGTLFAERLLDGIVLSVWILMGALWIGKSGTLLLVGIALSAGCTLGIVLVALAARRPESVEEFIWKATKRLPVRWHTRVGRWTANFVEGLGAFRSRRSLVRALWTSVAIWLCNFGMYVIIGEAFGIDLSAGGYFLLEGVGNLALGVPATAAGLGSFDYLTLISAQELNVPDNLGPAYVLTVHAMVVIPVTILGDIFLRTAFPHVFGTKDDKVRQREEAEEQLRHEGYQEAQDLS